MVFILFSELLRQNTGLTVPILDALSNLNLSSDLLAEVYIYICISGENCTMYMYFTVKALCE